MRNIKHDHLDFSGYWRICWFGRLDKHPNFPSTDCVNVFIGKIATPPAAGEKWDYHLTEGHPIPVLIPVAEIPRLFINAVLKDGRVQRVPKRLAPGEVNETVLFNFQEGHQKIIHRFQHDETDKPYIPYKKSPLIDDWDALISHPDKGESAVLQPGIDANAVGYFLLARDEQHGQAYAFPCFEIFRFFYAVSSRLAEAVVAGHFRDPDHHLWSLEKTQLEERKGFLSLRKRMIDADARHIARFAFDPVATARAARIGNELSVRMALGIGKVLVVRPPVDGNLQLNLVSREASNGVRVVTRILSCDWAPPFDELVFERENDGRKGEGQETEGLPETNWPPVRHVPSNDNGGAPQELGTAPATKLLPPRAIEEAEFNDRFPKLSKIRPLKAEKFIQTTVSGKKGVKALDDAGNVVSTICGTPSGEILQEAILTAQNQAGEEIVDPKQVAPNQVDPSFQEVGGGDVGLEEDGESSLPTLIRMIDMFLAAKRVGLDVEFLMVLDEYISFEGVPLGVFPKKIDGRAKKWCLVDEESGLLRLVMVVAIRHDGRMRYVLDPQQKRHGEFSSLILWSPEEKEIPSYLIRDALLGCAAVGRLNLEGFCNLMGLCWGRRRHTGIEGTPAAADHFITTIFQTTDLNDI